MIWRNGGDVKPKQVSWKLNKRDVCIYKYVIAPLWLTMKSPDRRQVVCHSPFSVLAKTTTKQIGGWLYAPSSLSPMHPHGSSHVHFSILHYSSKSVSPSVDINFHQRHKFPSETQPYFIFVNAAIRACWYQLSQTSFVYIIHLCIKPTPSLLWPTVR